MLPLPLLCQSGVKFSDGFGTLLCCRFCCQRCANSAAPVVAKRYDCAMRGKEQGISHDDPASDAGSCVDAIDAARLLSADGALLRRGPHAGLRTRPTLRARASIISQKYSSPLVASAASQLASEQQQRGPLQAKPRQARGPPAWNLHSGLKASVSVSRCSCLP